MGDLIFFYFFFFGPEREEHPRSRSKNSSDWQSHRGHDDGRDDVEEVLHGAGTWVEHKHNNKYISWKLGMFFFKTGCKYFTVHHRDDLTRKVVLLSHHSYMTDYRIFSKSFICQKSCIFS